MSSRVTRSEQDAAFLAAVASELTSRRPDLAAAITATDSGLAVTRPGGGTIIVGQARFACVLGWAVAGPEPFGVWPAAGEDIEGIVAELLRRYDAGSN